MPRFPLGTEGGMRSTTTTATTTTTVTTTTTTATGTTSTTAIKWMQSRNEWSWTLDREWEWEWETLQLSSWTQTQTERQIVHLFSYHHDYDNNNNNYNQIRTTCVRREQRTEQKRTEEKRREGKETATPGSVLVSVSARTTVCAFFSFFLKPDCVPHTHTHTHSYTRTYNDAIAHTFPSFWFRVVNAVRKLQAVWVWILSSSPSWSCTRKMCLKIWVYGNKGIWKYLWQGYSH